MSTTTVNIGIGVGYFMLWVAFGVWWYINRKWTREDRRWEEKKYGMEIGKLRHEVIKDEQRFRHSLGEPLDPDKSRKTVGERDDEIL